MEFLTCILAHSGDYKKAAKAGYFIKKRDFLSSQFVRPEVLRSSDPISSASGRGLMADGIMSGACKKGEVT